MDGMECRSETRLQIIGRGMRYNIHGIVAIAFLSCHT